MLFVLCHLQAEEAREETQQEDENQGFGEGVASGREVKRQRIVREREGGDM